MPRMKKREIEVEYETEKGTARLRHDPEQKQGYQVRIRNNKGLYTVQHASMKAEAMQLIREQLL